MEITNAMLGIGDIPMTNEQKKVVHAVLFLMERDRPLPDIDDSPVTYEQMLASARELTERMHKKIKERKAIANAVLLFMENNKPCFDTDGSLIITEQMTEIMEAASETFRAKSGAGKTWAEAAVREAV